ncbi:hypothetical protein BL107_10736 [Synechococcus sp. BL107]|uniref:hypothetical protein n=1 Tax=unclassified Synechococcus TaxID=2626047 RepID=UPI0000698997|nr:MULTISPECIES: hypothetical protein [unclassified Synechococcus]EAQ73534.1 hypothetical protein WH5701_16345 [Synechococcus sp. WH 5701]EAU70538.1 hypothetical protein BL107_10736 [Synechococcus sp. BL107]
MTSVRKMTTICITPELSAAIEGRRKQWGLKSKGEVIDRLLDWMTKEPVEGKD